MSVSALPASTSTSTAKLVELANGEYTAASVSADPTDAAKLGLVKEKDGNYGVATAPAASGGTAAAQSSSGVLAALASLTLGG
jgi:hypothetical protein